MDNIPKITIEKRTFKINGNEDFILEYPSNYNDIVSKKLQNLEVDAAFFPVDGRLGESQEKGVIEFVKQVSTKNLIAMHRVGYSSWIPSHNFKSNAPADMNIWSPTKPGEKIFVE